MIPAEQLLQSLNEEQRQAVLHQGSDSLILAGAGSGKTRVLTTKIAYLLSQGVPPSRILALTFTNKAAGEMRERIGAMVGSELSKMLQMGTFHSVFARWLRQFGHRLGYTSDYTIYDATDSRTLVKVIIREMQLDDKRYKPNNIQSLISAAKNDGISPNEISSPKLDKLPVIYSEYEARCKRANAMDFDDLLLNTHRLLKNDEEVARVMRQRFSHILVDEYQDTNLVQDQIIRLLKGEDTEITVVGDDAQSIYSFRGAVLDNILHFQSHFPDTRLFKLTKNYRSTANIVGLANSLIEKNQFRIPKEVEAVAGEGEKPTLFKAFSGSAEAEMIVLQIRELIRQKVSPDEIAVLYRTNAQSRVIEEQCRNAGINYRIYGGTSFYDRKEIKDILAYLRLMTNDRDDEAFRRIYNVPARGIGQVTFDKIAALAEQHQVPLMQVALRTDLLSAELNKGALKKVADFTTLIDGLSSQKDQLSPEELVRLVIRQTGINTLYQDGSIDSESRLDNMEELLSAVADYVDTRIEETGDTPTIEDFVRDMALYTDRDQQEDDTPRVTLMTMHASKGLEYRHVFCTGIEEGIIPSQRSWTPQDIEEERRLLYVAITRAKEHCTLSYADTRRLHGLQEICAPSRFLLDLTPKYLHDLSGLFGQGTREIPRQRPPIERPQPIPTPTRRRLKPLPPEPTTGPRVVTDTSSDTDLRAGDRVSHQAFGDGTIQGFEDSISGTKVHIIFDSGKDAKFILKFAKLTPIRPK